MGSALIHVVDGDLENRKHLCQLLSTSGYSVQEHDQAHHFIEYFQPDEVDCALVAMRMGGVSGLDVLRWRRQTDQSLPMIMIANYSDVSAVIEAFQLGAEAMVTLPICEHVVLDQVNHVLAAT